MSHLSALPRPEYPRPQWVRPEWINLNGRWQFEIDHGKSGRERGLQGGSHELSGVITVPFCPESKLSGVEYTDFMAAVWYRREFTLPEDWSDGRTLLHFGAVDYKAEVWVNGVSAGSHRGGYTPFSFDITALIVPGNNVITVNAEDDVRSGRQPRGKQSELFHSHGCDYTRTTGIWQTVWLEHVADKHLSDMKIIADPDNACVHLEVNVSGNAAGGRVTASAQFAGAAAGEASVLVSGPSVRLTLPLSEVHLWEPGNAKLYDLKLSLQCEGQECDAVDSYFGLRTVRLDGMAFRINGKSVFQRLVLDQGFYPDGIYTAPSDEDLRRDIEISLGLGFNGARLHEKMFEPRFLYWADQLGYLVWGEHANWGLNITTAEAVSQFLPEWLEGMQRDFNHPALIGWCPFNETWDRDGVKQHDDVLQLVYEVSKRMDPTRPVIDTSGNFHVVTDIFDLHDYDQNPETFRARYEPMKDGGEVFNTFPDRQTYAGQPYFISEYGGIWWNPQQLDEKSWGYGDRPASEEAFLARYAGLTDVLLDHPMMFGFCYTQLYDVEQEVNGLYTYDRQPKFAPEVIRRINGRKAAIED
ncbi:MULTISPECIES: sugar-binding domain-containing protein [unclassified Paenibacillus]|uniref:glycoside hydrolase family 2 protein n=1 Tax=unclassified Paenibacillus TaxID=185978 RepID=UPI002404E0CD|nr:MULTISPECIES: sugar-binding domain-containing protein [unclassified Paenibacillus]MDF9843864.1 beta-galactosidase/beta-glucuronidase [Paenibacillus sp. PastF-2]MDF9850452.1 beta-galactosidase/beta-glucuronidase [Paenibacillus sp. PastM-2]MDF9857043.1 beta-galactosidase/beta-glucuronidase [Paenibacillus sp. PastF-1]MDH6482315.1 beta-galactosidase/beta-glucuronidase [Paenibacillus sp. PastH-2]MDH6509718.1 beta-galactosidase/beta-glucuronidase [Paenibacillus sp. PastM-3]